ncbi:MAG: type II toxin-antitoxin system PemK/MazF family toxin [Ancrocorticia sp.]|nr:type II toxin-antitoxin system PemK/MazF family toxin [Ancrocorticia sp.]
MLTPGDVVELDLGAPTGAEAGSRGRAIIVTARQILLGNLNVVQVVPLTRTIRESGSEINIQPDEQNGLDTLSVAQCQHIRAIASSRLKARIGTTLQQVRETIALIIDI